MAKKRKSKKRPRKNVSRPPAPPAGEPQGDASRPAKPSDAAEKTRRPKKTVVRTESYPAVSTLLIVLVAALPIITFPRGDQAFTLIRQWLLFTLACAGAAAIIGYWLRRKSVSALFVGLEIPWLLLLGVLTLCTLFAIRPATSMWGDLIFREGLATWIAYALVFFLAVQSFRREAIRSRLVTVIKYSSLVIAAYGILQAFGADFLKSIVPSFSGKVSAFLGNPAYLGGYLALVAPLFLCLAADRRLAKSSRRGHAVTFAVLMVVAVLTQSRACWVSLALTTAIAITFSLHLRGDATWRAALKGFGVVVLVLLLIVALGLGVSKSFREKTFASGKNSVNSANVRLMTYAMTARMAFDEGLLGNGLGNYELASSRYITASWERKVGHELPGDPHNLLLGITAASGFLGLAVLLFLLVRLGIVGGRRFFSVGEKDRYLAGGLLLGAVGYLTVLMLNPSLLEITSIFWILAGCAFSIPTKGPDRSERSREFPLGKGHGSATAFAWMGFVIAVLLTLVVAFYFNYPIMADAFERKAMASWDANNRQVAVSYARKAASWDHRFVEYGFQEAKMLLSLAQVGSDPALYVEARKRLSALARRNPDMEEVQMMYALSMLKEFEAFNYRPVAERKPLLEKMTELYRNIVANDPNYADAQFKLARCEMYENKFKAAISRAIKASKLSPYLPEPWDIAGNCYLLMGDKPASDRAFAKAHEVLEQGAKSK